MPIQWTSREWKACRVFNKIKLTSITPHNFTYANPTCLSKIQYPPKMNQTHVHQVSKHTNLCNGIEDCG